MGASVPDTEANCLLADGPSADDLYSEVFLQRINVTMLAADWTALKTNYLLNTYYTCDVEWTNEKGLSSSLTNCGIRSKGAGSRSGTKPHLKIRMDRYVAGQKLLGLRDIDLDNCLQDFTMMVERLVMKIFSDASVKAPRVVHARLFVNGVYSGLYQMIEVVEDTAFLTRNFADSTGHLYQIDPPDASDLFLWEYRGSSYSLYQNVLKLELGPGTPDHTPLINLLDALNNQDDASFISGVDGYLSWNNELLKYLALEALVAETDGAIGDYATANNTYLYRLTGVNTFKLIPWDKDVSMTDWRRDIFANFEAYFITRRISKFRTYYNTYLTNLQNYVAAHLVAATMVARVNTIYTQIEDAVITDTLKPYTDKQVVASVDDLKNFMRLRGTEILRQVTAS